MCLSDPRCSQPGSKDILVVRNEVFLEQSIEVDEVTGITNKQLLHMSKQDCMGLTKTNCLGVQTRYPSLQPFVAQDLSISP